MFNVNDHMIQLKGKDYLQVMWRLVWFREERPMWGIDTQLVSFDADAKHAVFKATITDENGIMKSAGFGSESARDFGDYIEKAETKAVGRALAMLGYGTQFAPDLDEGERIVDSPVTRPLTGKAKLLQDIGVLRNKRQIKPEALDKACVRDYGKKLDELDEGELKGVLAKMNESA